MGQLRTANNRRNRAIRHTVARAHEAANKPVAGASAPVKKAGKAPSAES